MREVDFIISIRSLRPMVGRRHDGSEHSQPARFASWSLVFSVKSSLFLFAIRVVELRLFPLSHQATGGKRSHRAHCVIVYDLLAIDHGCEELRIAARMYRIGAQGIERLAGVAGDGGGIGRIWPANPCASVSAMMRVAAPDGTASSPPLPFATTVDLWLIGSPPLPGP